jgi:hypothetical protein
MAHRAFFGISTINRAFTLVEINVRSSSIQLERVKTLPCSPIVDDLPAAEYQAAVNSLFPASTIKRKRYLGAICLVEHEVLVLSTRGDTSVLDDNSLWLYQHLSQIETTPNMMRYHIVEHTQCRQVDVIARQILDKWQQLAWPNSARLISLSAQRQSLFSVCRYFQLPIPLLLISSGSILLMASDEGSEYYQTSSWQDISTLRQGINTLFAVYRWQKENMEFEVIALLNDNPELDECISSSLHDLDLRSSSLDEYLELGCQQKLSLPLLCALGAAISCHYVQRVGHYA